MGMVLQSFLIKNLFLRFLFLALFIFAFSVAKAQVLFSHKNNPLVKEAQSLYDTENDVEIISSISRLKEFPKKDTYDLLVWVGSLNDMNFKYNFFKAFHEKSASVLDEFLAIKPTNDEEIFRFNSVRYGKAFATENIEALSKTTLELKSLFDKGAKPLYNLISYGMYASYQGGSSSFKLDDISTFIVKNATKLNIKSDHFYVMASGIGNQTTANLSSQQQVFLKRRLEYSTAIIDKMAALKPEYMPDLLNLLWGEAHWVSSPQESIKVRKEYIYALNGILAATSITYPNASKSIKEARLLYTMFHDNQANQSALVEEFIKLQPSREEAFNKIIAYLNNLPYDGSLELLSPKNISWDKSFKDLIIKLDNFKMEAIFRYSNFLEDYLMANSISDNLVATVFQKIDNYSISDMVYYADLKDFDATYLNERIGLLLNKFNKIRILNKYKGSTVFSQVNLFYNLNYHLNYLMVNENLAANFSDLQTMVKSLNSKDVEFIGPTASQKYIEEYRSVIELYKGKINANQQAQLKELINSLNSKFSSK